MDIDEEIKQLMDRAEILRNFKPALDRLEAAREARAANMNEDTKREFKEASEEVVRLRKESREAEGRHPTVPTIGGDAFLTPPEDIAALEAGEG